MYRLIPIMKISSSMSPIQPPRTGVPRSLRMRLRVLATTITLCGERLYRSKSQGRNSVINRYKS